MDNPRITALLALHKEQVSLSKKCEYLSHEINKLRESFSDADNKEFQAYNVQRILDFAESLPRKLR